jgi:hypothetical protein
MQLNVFFKYFQIKLCVIYYGLSLYILVFARRADNLASFYEPNV